MDHCTITVSRKRIKEARAERIAYFQHRFAKDVEMLNRLLVVEKYDTLFQAQLGHFGACLPAREWVKERTAKWCWENCHHPGWMRWLLENMCWRSNRCNGVTVYFHRRSHDYYSATCDEIRQAISFDELRSLSNAQRLLTI